jgi:hypothetical protein
MADVQDWDLAELLGADEGVGIQALTLYIPSHDRNGRRLPDQDKWVQEAADLLVTLGGGATIPPAYRGGWHDPASGRTIWEEPILPYAYVDPDCLEAEAGRLREFLHRMGRETGQGEVAAEFDGEFFRITNFD